MLGGAVALFAIAARDRGAHRHPLIPFAVVRRGAVATAIAMMLIHGAAVTATLYFQSLYLQQVRGYSPLDAGLLMMPFALLIIAMPAFAAWLTTRYGPRAVAIVALAVETGGLCGSRAGASTAAPVQVVLPAIVVGLGGGDLLLRDERAADLRDRARAFGPRLGALQRRPPDRRLVGLAALTVVAASHATRSRGAQSIPPRPPPATATRCASPRD